jgi:hypothetical protein
MAVAIVIKRLVRVVPPPSELFIAEDLLARKKLISRLRQAVAFRARDLKVRP